MGAFRAKRQYKRSIMKEGVRITSPDGLEYSTSEDLSAGGVKIYLDRDPQIGSILELQFTLRSPEGKLLTEIKTLGKVVRSVKSNSGYQVGLQFLNLQDRAQVAINEMISSDKDGPF